MYNQKIFQLCQVKLIQLPFACSMNTGTILKWKNENCSKAFQQTRTNPNHSPSPKAQALKEGDKPLPDATVEYYLKNSPAFICDSKKVSFKKIDTKTGYQESDGDGNKKFTSTTAFVFHLDMLNLSVERPDPDKMPF